MKHKIENSIQNFEFSKSNIKTITISSLICTFNECLCWDNIILKIQRKTINFTNSKTKIVIYLYIIIKFY